MSSTSPSDKLHVVMLPWSAFGHMIPFLQLSIALAKHKIHVSFLTTPKNILRLHKMVPQNLSEFVAFVPLPMPKTTTLPPDAESTLDISPDQMDDLKVAVDLLEKPVREFVSEASPDWIVVDFFHHWVVDIARDFDVPVVKFYVTSAATAAIFWSPEFATGGGGDGDDWGEKYARPSPKDLTVSPGWVDFPSNIAYKNHEAVAMHEVLYGNENVPSMPGGEREMRLIQASQAITIRTCPELEANYLKVFEKITCKIVIPLGLLPPKKRKFDTTDEKFSCIFSWLDERDPKSVMFVGFGSECKLNKNQIHEIAHGIELSGVNFLWVLNKPDWVDEDNNNPLLPLEFLRRTAGRGMVHVGWVPQREILAHASIGGSFFHAGWGSIMETLQHGHVLVFLPFIIDQPLNARLLEEKGLGIEVERDELDGSFSRNDVAKALVKAMVSEEGEELRRRANEAGGNGIFGDQQLHDGYIQKFVDYLRNGKNEKY